MNCCCIKRNANEAEFKVRSNSTSQNPTFVPVDTNHHVMLDMRPYDESPKCERMNVVKSIDKSDKVHVLGRRRVYICKYDVDDNVPSPVFSYDVNLSTVYVGVSPRSELYFNYEQFTD
jgi:hypothetical protein